MSCPDFHLDKLYFDSFKGGEDNADSMDFSVLIDTEKAACSLQGKYEGEEGEIIVISGDKEHCEKYINRTNKGLKCSKKTFDDLYFDDFEGGEPYDRLSFNIRANTRGLVSGVSRCVLKPNQNQDIDCTAGFEGDEETCINKAQCEYIEPSRSGSCTVSGEYYGEKRDIYSGGTNEICEEFNLQHGEKVTNNEIKQIIDESISAKAHDVYQIKERVNNNDAAPAADDDSDDSPDVFKKTWSELTTTQKASAGKLGFSNQGAPGQVWPKLPDGEWEDWSVLSSDKKDAADVLKILEDDWSLLKPTPDVTAPLTQSTTDLIKESKLKIGLLKKQQSDTNQPLVTSYSLFKEDDSDNKTELEDIISQSEIDPVYPGLVTFFIFSMLFLSIDFSKVNLTKKMIETTPKATYGIIAFIFCLSFTLVSIFFPQLFGKMNACGNRITDVEEEDQEDECESNKNCVFNKKRAAYTKINTIFDPQTKNLNVADLQRKILFRKKIVNFCADKGNTTILFKDLTQDSIDGNNKLTPEDINFRRSKFPQALNDAPVCEEEEEVDESTCENRTIDQITELNIDGYRYLGSLILFVITMLSIGFLVSQLIDGTSFYDFCIRNFDKKNTDNFFAWIALVMVIFTIVYVCIFISNTFHFINLFLIKDISSQNRTVKCYKDRNIQVNCCSTTNVETCDMENSETGLINDSPHYVINPDIYHNKYMISLYPDYKYLDEIFTIYKRILYYLVFTILFTVFILSPLPKIAYNDFKYEDNTKLFVLPGLIMLYIFINVSMFSVSTDNPLWVVDIVDVVNFFISMSFIAISMTYFVKNLLTYLTVSDVSEKKSSLTYLYIFGIFSIICLGMGLQNMYNSDHLSEIYRLNYFENKKMLTVNWKDYNDGDISVKSGVVGSENNNRYGSGIKTYHGLNNHFRLTGYIYLIISLIIIAYGFYVLYAVLTKDKKRYDKLVSLMVMIISFSLYNLLTTAYSNKGTFTESPLTENSNNLADSISNFRYKNIQSEGSPPEAVLKEDQYYSFIKGTDTVELDTGFVQGWRQIVTLHLVTFLISFGLLCFIFTKKDDIFKNVQPPHIVIAFVCVTSFMVCFFLNILFIFRMDNDNYDTDNYTYYENCTDLDILPSNLQDKYTYNDVGLDLYIDNTVTGHIKEYLQDSDITSNRNQDGHIFEICLKNK